MLPEDELKSAFIDICLPNWQQEFLKTGANERSSTWEEILAKAEALENVEIALAEQAPAKEKRDLKDGEVAPATQPSPKKKKKKTLCCRLRGADQNHNSEGCKAILAEIERLKKDKQGQKPTQFSNSNNNQQSAKPNWIDRKRPAVSHGTKQLKDIVRMTKKKVLEKAKANFEMQLQDNLWSMSVNDDAAQDRAKMLDMENFMNNSIDDDTNNIEEEGNLTQAELDELTVSLSE